MAEVEPPVRLPGACDPAAELDLAQMGDDDALAGLGSGVHFAWQEIQQLMETFQAAIDAIEVIRE